MRHRVACRPDHEIGDVAGRLRVQQKDRRHRIESEAVVVDVPDDANDFRECLIRRCTQCGGRARDRPENTPGERLVHDQHTWRANRVPSIEGPALTHRDAHRGEISTADETAFGRLCSRADRRPRRVPRPEASAAAPRSGRNWIVPAAFTPELFDAIENRSRAAIRASGGHAEEHPIVTVPSGRNPRSTRTRLENVRSNSPAPIKSTTASATSATTRNFLIR